MNLDFLTSPIAAVVHDGSSPFVDLVLEDVARRLKARDLKLGGLIQHNFERDGIDCAEMLLEDLTSGRKVSISLRGSPGSKGCRLDPAGLADAAALAAAGIAEGVDLAIISKFGAQEAAGRGLRDEIALAISHGTPLLTSVGEKLLPAWREFIGGDWLPLIADPSAIEAWALSAIEARTGEPVLGP